MSQLNQKPEKNRNEQEQKITGLKDKIDERRYQVYLMDLQGISNNEIADNLGASLSTKEKDLHHMQYCSIKGFREVVEGDGTKSFLESYNQIGLVQTEIWKMYRSEKDLIAKKRILDSIVTSSIKKAQRFKRKSGYSEN